MKHNIFQSLKTIALAILLSFGLSYVYAWTAPTVNPPAGNVEAPINTSTTGQVKNGGLAVTNFVADKAIIGGNVQIKNTDPWGVSMMVTNLSGANTWRFVSGGAVGDGNVPAGGMAIHHDSNNSPIQINNDGTVFMNVGNVGIGTLSPQQNLSIGRYLNVDQSDSDIGATGVFHGIIFGSNSGESIGSNRNMASASYGGLDFYTGWAKRMSIAEISGNVGIGTETPGEKLEVNGNVRYNDYVLSNQSSYFGKGSTLVSGGAVTDTGILTGGNILFGTNAGVGNTERMRITSTGNVGIGVPTPGAKLDVAGTIRPGSATVTGACSTIGAQAYNSATGAPLYCNGTVWKAVGGGVTCTLSTPYVTRGNDCSAGEVMVGFWPNRDSAWASQAHCATITCL